MYYFKSQIHLRIKRIHHLDCYFGKLFEVGFEFKIGIPSFVILGT